jgi:hypothetical protein
MDRQFLGVAGNALYQYIVRCRKKFEKCNFYGKFVSVCNSSGTGKTKTILQVPSCHLRHKVWMTLTSFLQLMNYQIPLLYINMRDPNDDKNFPPRDPEIANLFESVSATTVRDYYHACTLIFRSLFRQLLDEFTMRLSRTHEDFIAMIAEWNEDFTPVAPDTQKRQDFFDAVKNLYDQVRCSLFIRNIDAESCHLDGCKSE